jgi:hypothetical protein
VYKENLYLAREKIDVVEEVIASTMGIKKAPREGAFFISSPLRTVARKSTYERILIGFLVV